MNWDDLRFFLAVCRVGSVKGAGAALGVSHTTVLRRIQAFEEALGARLFDRTRRGYRMTAAAEELLDHAVAVEAEVQSLHRQVFGRAARPPGPGQEGGCRTTARTLVVDDVPTPGVGPRTPQPTGGPVCQHRRWGTPPPELVPR